MLSSSSSFLLVGRLEERAWQDVAWIESFVGSLSSSLSSSSSLLLMSKLEEKIEKEGREKTESFVGRRSSSLLSLSLLSFLLMCKLEEKTESFVGRWSSSLLSLSLLSFLLMSKLEEKACQDVSWTESFRWYVVIVVVVVVFVVVLVDKQAGGKGMPRCGLDRILSLEGCHRRRCCRLRRRSC